MNSNKGTPVSNQVQSAWLGYIPLTKDTPIPQAIEEIKLTSAEKGPVNLKVMRPFRYMSCPISPAPDEDGKEASLGAYQLILKEALKIVGGNKRNRFALYVAYESNNLDTRLIGFIYKV